MHPPTTDGAEHRKGLAPARSTSYGRDVPVEVACDESGFTGGNLTFRHTVFAHASLRVRRDVALAEMTRLRHKVAAHGELKASWLLRWCDRGDLDRLLGPDGLLHGAALVHLTDTRLFLLTRLTDVLLGPAVAAAAVSGLDLPGEQAATREPALVLRRDGERAFGARRWQDFLMVAGNALRTNSRWVPATAAEDLADALRDLAGAPAPPPVRRALVSLHAAAGRTRAIRRSLEEDPRLPPLLEPLLPALTRAVLRWGADHPALVIVHDEQSALTPWRVAEMGRRLGRQHPGHVLDLVRVDSRDDPRVQVADLVAGIARRAAASLLTGRPEPYLLELVRPLVDPRSIWADDAWSPDLLSPGRRPELPRDAGGRSYAPPA